MKRNALLVLVCIWFSSCFEVVEELDLKSTGSGTFTYTINLSQSKTEMNAIMDMDSVNGMKVPSKLETIAYIKDAEAILKNQKGITSVSHTVDWDNFILVAKVGFDSINNLTKALQSSYAHFSKNTVLLNDGFYMEGKTLERKSTIHQLRVFQLDPAKKEALGKASYTSVYRFDKVVKSMTNKDAIKSGNGKAVMLRLSMKQLLNKSKNLLNTITFTE